MRYANSITLLFFIGFYAIFFFPYTYFRHDDWLNLNTGLQNIQTNWHLLFKPTFIMGDEEVTWFFRPFFKGIYWLCYKVFGFNYQAYLWVSLLTTAGALASGYALVKSVKDETQALLFLLLAAVAFHIHFGSLAWAGEGLMNAPVLFLGLFSTYSYSEALRGNKSWYWLGFVFFFLSLGFKEAAVFQILFHFAVAVHEHPKVSLNKKIRFLLPYGVLSACYLVFRLLVLPLNPSYAPTLTVATVTYSLALLTFTFTLPALGILLGGNRFRFSWAYLPYFGISLLPYIGQQFFSFGWLLLPGIHFILFLTLSLKVSPRLATAPLKVSLGVPTAFTLVVSLTAVGLKAKEIGWFQWAQPQKDVHQIVSHFDPKTSSVYISECKNEKFPGSSMARVAASGESIKAILSIHQNRNVTLRHVGCDPTIVPPEGTLLMSWKFPKVEMLTAKKD